MINFIKSVLRKYSHGEMIEMLLNERKGLLRDTPVFVETGCGASTIALSKCAGEFKATAYSLDYSIEKCNELKSRAGSQISNVEFIIGDSLESLSKIVSRNRIDFLFLDSAASAMHTFHEFLICESALSEEACILVDNAALPGKRLLLSPARKGKILVHYLLASPHWEVRAHPRAGDSMISAIYRKDANFADSRYEDPDYMDNWHAYFKKSL